MTNAAEKSKDVSRCSDVESSPPVQAAGFVGDEIPRVDPLDSDGEWADLRPEPQPRLRLVPEPTTEGEGVASEEEKKKKKRKKKKSKGVKGAKALEVSGEGGEDQITGFEEYFAEPPMKPEQAEEEEALYDVKLPVAV
jgi:hypothetical protein